MEEVMRSNLVMIDDETNVLRHFVIRRAAGIVRGLRGPVNAAAPGRRGRFIDGLDQKSSDTLPAQMVCRIEVLQIADVVQTRRTATK